MTEYTIGKPENQGNTVHVSRILVDQGIRMDWK